MPTENCPFDPLAPLQKDLPFEDRQVLSFAQYHINGMGCDGCASLIRNSLLALPGVVTVEIEHVSHLAGVVYNPQVVDHQAMQQAIDLAGGDTPRKYHANLIS